MKYLSLVCLALIMFSCQDQKKANNSNSPAAAISAYHAAQAPADLSNPVERAEYMLEHYWDQFNFQDTALALNPEHSEQAIVDYIGLMPIVSEQKVNESLEDLFNQAKIEPKTMEYFRATMDRYLSDPNSPLRNDTFYEALLVNTLKTDHLSENQKIKYETLLPLVRKNKPGTTAEDFKYLNTDGSTASLKGLQADYTFLMFYEPGCSSCEEAIAVLKQDEGFNKLIADNKLKILAIYPDGNKEIWESYQANIPKNWINGLDEEQYVVSNALYQIRATPTIYLLDRHKKVLLKDANLAQVSQLLFPQ